MSELVVAAVRDVRLAIADLRASWCWLAELARPGPETRAAPVLSDSERSRQAATIAAERAERAAPGRWTGVGLKQFRSTGSSALARTATPARLGPVDAQIAVRHLALAAARRVANALGTSYDTGRAGDHAVQDALDWLDGGSEAWMVARDGTIWRRTAGGALDELLDAAAAAEADRKLRRADRIARAQAGITDDHLVPFGHPCPACGARSLQWNMPRPEWPYRRDWSVRCVSEACRCKGDECACRQVVRFAGRRHAWAYGELDGPYGLWWAIDRATTPPERLRSTAAGHGGWADRRVTGS